MHEIDDHNHMLNTTMSTDVYERVEILDSSKHWNHMTWQVQLKQWKSTDYTS